METTAQEKLIQFILSLTDAECEMIDSFLSKERTLGEADCSAPNGGRYLIAVPQHEKSAATGACL